MLGSRLGWDLSVRASHRRAHKAIDKRTLRGKANWKKAVHTKILRQAKAVYRPKLNACSRDFRTTEMRQPVGDCKLGRNVSMARAFASIQVEFA